MKYAGLEQFNESASFLRKAGVNAPKVGVILGTGLGNRFAREIRNPLTIEYSDIPHFPESTVESHHGKLIYGEMHGKQVLAMQGRFHYYEGYDLRQITLPVRVMKLLGIENLLISNAAGNINPAWTKGELMLLDDHINLLPDHPLRGPNVDSLGPRFPDMSEPYSKKLNRLLREIALEKNITLREGVYAALQGPTLETRAEYRYVRILGADAVGMSTVPEVIVAHHMRLPCCGISVLTDDGFPDQLREVNMQEILAIAATAEPALTELYGELIRRL
jgi:purine-nucleoside phosphorylase